MLTSLGLPFGAPRGKHEKKKIYGAVDLKATLSIFQHGYFYYQGSLTTPPCTENVEWYVATEELKVSQTQTRALSCLITSTNRDPEFGIAGRTFTKNVPR